MGDTNINTEEEVNEEEVEQKFKYKRLANDLQGILKNDSLTCAAVHPKFLILGSSNGRLYLLDHQGNTVNSYFNTSHSSPHEVGVNEISVDSKGEYVATCSDDGKVVITALFNKDNNQKINIGTHVKTVALDPDSKFSAGKRFIVGDNKLTMYEKSFLNNLKSSTLCHAEGCVLSVSWNGPFVAWASLLGVGIYDLNEKCSLGMIKWDCPRNTKLIDFRCNFRWLNATTLLIGWGDIVRICVLRKRIAPEILSKRNEQDLIIDPITTFQTSIYICGLAPLNENQIVVLGYPKGKDAKLKALRPVLCLIEYEFDSCTEICIDSLPLKGYEDYKVNDYMLGCIMEDNHYFIIAPNDVVVASPFEIDDHVESLIRQRKFEEAMDVISRHTTKISLVEFTRLYIDYLLSQEKFDEAAKLCIRVLGNNKEILEEEIFKFVAYKQLFAIGSYLPTKEDDKLNPNIYEMFLREYFNFDKTEFLNLIKKWPRTLYDTSTIVNLVESNFCENDEIYESLAILYSHQEKLESAISMYSKLKKEDVFDTMAILIKERQIPAAIVVKQLEQNQQYLYKYLYALDKVHSCGEFHCKLVDLYAKFNRKELLPLLKRSKNYPVEEAFNICKRELFYPEMVYLLGRMGNTKDALNIIIYKLKNIEMAMDFCKEYNDSDLWNDLIDESLDNPEMMGKLLEGIIGYVDAKDVISKIKLGQKIPGLKKFVSKILDDYRSQIRIRKSVGKIALNNISEYQEQLVKAQNRGKYISCDDLCAGCMNDVLREPIERCGLVIFGCGHIFHESCLPENFVKDKCNICTKKKNLEK